MTDRSDKPTATTTAQDSLTPALLARMQARLQVLYGPAANQTVAALAARIRAFRAAHAMHADPSPLGPADVMLIAYGDHIHAPGAHPLATLADFYSAHLSDVINTVHLLPFYPSSSDDGFAVVDYHAVDPAIGDWADIDALRNRCKLMFDFVLNHISSQSAWFQAFLRDEDPYCDYIITANPNDDLSMVTRPRTHPLLTPFMTPAGMRYVWTTFSADQVDLNFANPAVLLAMVDVLLFYVGHGADFIRLDAVAYLWKAIGTSSIHLPQTHLVIKLIRDVLDAAAPQVRLISETNVPHAENVTYFGSGRDEAQLVYQFALPPLLLDALYTGKVAILAKWARALTTPSPETAFFNFTASHDGIGMRPAADLLSHSAIETILNTVTARGGALSYKSNPDGTQSVYELNVTYFDALRVPEEPLARSVDRFMVSQAIMLALAGMPGIYLNSLIGAPNWAAGAAESGRARTINRQKFERPTLEAELADSQSRAALVLNAYKKLLRLRKDQPAFAPTATQSIPEVHAAVFAIERTPTDAERRILALHNVSDQPIVVTVPEAYRHDLLSNSAASGQVALAPYQVAWLTPYAPASDHLQAGSSKTE